MSKLNNTWHKLAIPGFAEPCGRGGRRGSDDAADGIRRRRNHIRDLPSHGSQVADVFEQNLKGEFVAENGMELRAEVLATDSAEEEPLS